MHRSPWYLFALSRWASHPAVSAFVLSWKQQCDRSWVGVRDELWGNGQVFTAEGERRGGGKKGRGETSKARQRWLMESSLRGLWHGGGGGAGVFTLSLLQGMLLLCCLADLKSANPFICVESRSCLVNNSLYKFFFCVTQKAQCLSWKSWRFNVQTDISWIILFLVINRRRTLRVFREYWIQHWSLYQLLDKLHLF